ncbi:MAG: hypothetical protein U1A07_07770 [Phenylobacterium sp.]|nr:hypothetical protein [Phenylobacterium sp.]MDZ4318726.1 hypothetical protein [Phenylobacterium sp.]
MRERKTAFPPSRFCGYTDIRAVVVVEARPFLFATECTTMIIPGLVVLVVALGVMCWLLFNLAAFALPLFAGVSVGLIAMDAGAGPLGGIFVGLLVGASTLVAGQLVFTLAPSIPVRLAVAALFAAPAALAGYHATLGLAAMAIPTEGWRQAFAIIGGLVIGFTALARLSLPRERVEPMAAREMRMSRH